ncbi:type 1 glutamine amidotransferase [Streptomyces sp. NPDC004629]|uniref:type 1 glutamine amidotransferase n=1 Tax=Streptomyces sp. NPDC004629 TaxID=3364705 RepID=UPI00368FE8DD
MGRTATVLAVRSSADSGPGRWGRWLSQGGVEVETVRADAGAPVPRRLAHSALLVLGGGCLPDDDERAPWLAATRELMRQALADGVPVFGICLGGQMLAQVAGGRVAGEHGAPEFGSTVLTMRPEAGRDPLFQGLPEHPSALENHVAAIVALPAGAHWLAGSERCPYQAFRVGEAAWGVQFHPEAGPERIRRWSEERLRRHGMDRAELHRVAAERDPATARTWREVALRFATRVRQHRT